MTASEIYINGKAVPDAKHTRTEHSGIAFHPDVKLGDKYWSISFKVKESKYQNYLFGIVGVPANMTYSKAMVYLDSLLKDITIEDIKEHDKFIEEGEDTKWN